MSVYWTRGVSRDTPRVPGPQLCIWHHRPQYSPQSTSNLFRHHRHRSCLVSLIFISPQSICSHWRSQIFHQQLHYRRSQGFVLGPVLLSLYISLIPQIASAFGFSQQQYADDTQLYIAMSKQSQDAALSRLGVSVCASFLVLSQRSCPQSRQDRRHITRHYTAG